MATDSPSLPPALDGARQQAGRFWQARAPRERQLILVMVVSVAFLLGWLTLVQPALRTLREAPVELDRLDRFLPRCSFSLDDWTIRDASAGSAWLEGRLEWSGSQPSDLHAERRPVRALFREVDGEQRLERMVLGPVERRLPEARP